MKLDENKLCFIMCVNNLELAREAEFYLRHQFLPSDMAVECQFIVDAKSLASAYNQAMLSSDAKYKVYLHQDVFVVYPYAVLELVRLFQNNPAVGLAGMIGAAEFTPDGWWWNSSQLVGRVICNHNGEMNEELSYRNEVGGSYVRMLDGFFLMTQYDIRWQEELFDGWHFYDASQCQEFSRNNYKIIVPYQKTPWCVHQCERYFGYKKEYAEYQKRYLAKYNSQA